MRDKVEILRNIANQADLQSLNVSIEAAGAGEGCTNGRIIESETAEIIATIQFQDIIE